MASDQTRAWNSEQYELLDFGDGRKLERFGGAVLDRPCPAALNALKQRPELWAMTNVVVEDRGTRIVVPLPEPWIIVNGGIQLELRVTPFGHVGLFPEHMPNWLRLIDRFSGKAESSAAPKFLNLFAYTGALSLIAATAGMHVVHVDSAAPTVAWARRNAERSSLEQASIRWIVEDARKFAAREIRRGNRYDAVVLDPPSYGHGPAGKDWRIERDLLELIEMCCELLAEPESAILISGHSDQPNERDVSTMLRGCLGDAQRRMQSGRQFLIDTAGRELDCGWFVMR